MTQRGPLSFVTLKLECGKGGTENWVETEGGIGNLQPANPMNWNSYGSSDLWGGGSSQSQPSEFNSNNNNNNNCQNELQLKQRLPLTVSKVCHCCTMNCNRNSSCGILWNKDFEILDF